ncbi:MAG: CinA family nicotinamide mononucleotide deamidase-related protein [Chlorobiaceae bacterium]
MRAEIITVGDELLKGQRVNTNATFIAEALAGIGIPVNRIVACSDIETEIVSVFSESLARSEIVLVTGGLGPTRDDRTRKAVQLLLGKRLVLSEEAYANLADLMTKRGLTMLDALHDQAMVIEGSHVITNTKGTAAGMIIGCGERFDNHDLVLMPGVPSEMKAMMELTVLPYFATRSSSFIRHTPVKTFGIGEVMLADMIVDIEDNLPEGTTLAYLPHAAGVTLMISSIGSDQDRVENDNRTVVDAIIRKASRFIYATSECSLEETIGMKLSRLGMTLAVAESCTGGLVAHRLTDVPGSSAYFLQGFVVYSNRAKEETLGVQKKIIEKFGAVSEEVARAMATGCLEKSGANIALSTTGIAGPSGGSPEKPVGMLCLALAAKNTGIILSKTLFMQGDRELNKLRFSEALLRELWEYLRLL